MRFLFKLLGFRRVEQSQIPAAKPEVAFPDEQVNQLAKAVIGDFDPATIHLREYSFSVPIEGAFIWHRQQNAVIGSARNNDTLRAITCIAGITWVALVGPNKIAVTRDWRYDWPDIEVPVLDLLVQHDRELLESGIRSSKD
jgi:hypothetical protein